MNLKHKMIEALQNEMISRQNAIIAASDRINEAERVAAALTEGGLPCYAHGWTHKGCDTATVTIYVFSLENDVSTIVTAIRRTDLSVGHVALRATNGGTDVTFDDIETPLTLPCVDAVALHAALSSQPVELAESVNLHEVAAAAKSRGLHLVTNGTEIKVSPVISPLWQPLPASLVHDLSGGFSALQGESSCA